MKSHVCKPSLNREKHGAYLVKKNSNTFFTVRLVAREMAASNVTRNNKETNIHITIIPTQYLENLGLVDLSLALCFQLQHNTGKMLIFLCFLLPVTSLKWYNSILSCTGVKYTPKIKY